MIERSGAKEASFNAPCTPDLASRFALRFETRYGHLVRSWEQLPPQLFHPPPCEAQKVLHGAMHAPPHPVTQMGMFVPSLQLQLCGL